MGRLRSCNGSIYRASRPPNGCQRFVVHRTAVALAFSSAPQFGFTGKEYTIGSFRRQRLLEGREQGVKLRMLVTSRANAVTSKTSMSTPVCSHSYSGEIGVFALLRIPTRTSTMRERVV